MWKFEEKCDYFYFCQNESIDGVEYREREMRRVIDTVKAHDPSTIIVSDMSSAIGSVPL
jgi:phosphoserine aminotransferase